MYKMQIYLMLYSHKENTAYVKRDAVISKNYNPLELKTKVNKITFKEYSLYETKREPLQLKYNLFLKMFSSLILMCTDLRISIIT